MMIYKEQARHKAPVCSFIIALYLRTWGGHVRDVRIWGQLSSFLDCIIDPFAFQQTDGTPNGFYDPVGVQCQINNKRVAPPNNAG